MSIVILTGNDGTSKISFTQFNYGENLLFKKGIIMFSVPCHV